MSVQDSLTIQTAPVQINFQAPKQDEVKQESDSSKLPKAEVVTCPYIISRGDDKGKRCDKKVFTFTAEHKGAHDLWYCNKSHATSSLKQEKAASKSGENKSVVSNGPFQDHSKKNGHTSKSSQNPEEEEVADFPLPAMPGAPDTAGSQDGAEQGVAPGDDPDEQYDEDELMKSIHKFYIDNPQMAKLVPRRMMSEFPDPLSFLEYLRATRAKDIQKNGFRQMMRVCAYKIESVVCGFKNPMLDLKGFAAAVDNDQVNNSLDAVMDDPAGPLAGMQMSPTAVFLLALATTAMGVTTANQEKRRAEMEAKNPGSFQASAGKAKLLAPDRHTEEYRDIVAAIPLNAKPKAPPKTVVSMKPAPEY